jgi:hypothetical protein
MRHPHGLRAAAGGAANITFIASAKSINSFTINKPTGTLEGHLMVAFLNTDSTQGRTWTPPSGWTETLDPAIAPSITVCYKVAGASEGASYTWTLSGPGNASGIICTYANAVWDTVGTMSTTNASGVQTAPAITLAASGSTLFAYFAATGASRTWSSPSSGLVLVDENTTSTAPDFILYSQANVGSGSSGTKSATINTTTGNLGCVLAAIKPS